MSTDAARPIDRAGVGCEHNAMLEVRPVPALRDNYIWLIVHPDRRAAAIVDPGDAAPVLSALAAQELEAAAILITHHHPDHTGGVRELLRRHPVPVFGPATEQIPGRSVALGQGDRAQIAALQAEFSILDIPGHTAGHIAYFGHGMVFVGDTLFSAGCGRLFEGTPAQMHASLSRLAALPPPTLVYCGHEYTEANLRFAAAVEPENPDIRLRRAECAALRAAGRPTVPSALELELRTNPFLRVAEPAVRAAAEKFAGAALGGADEVLGAVRRWKDGF